MKKIYKFIKGIIKGIFGNIDYLLTFALGAAAYKFAPEQLESIYSTITTFDYSAAFEATKGFLMAAYDLGVEAFNYAVALVKGDMSA